MRATTVTDDLIQLTRLRFVNSYLVREGDGFTLVEPTVSGGRTRAYPRRSQPAARFGGSP